MNDRPSRAKSARVGVPMPDAFRKPGQEFLVAFARVTTHDAAQGGVGFQRRGIDTDRFPLRVRSFQARC